MANFSELNADWVQDKKVKELKRIYKNSRDRLLAELRNIDSITDFRQARINALLIQIDDEIRRLNKKSTSWSRGVIKSRYRQGVNLSRKDLIRLGVTNSIQWDAQIHKSGLNIVIDHTIDDLLFANQSMSKNIKRYIRNTQQAILSERQINRQISQGIIEGVPRKKVSNTILDQFKKRMKEGQLIQINGRNYDPVKYTDMLARTRIREATSQGALNTAKQYDIDLIQIDVHTDACPICQQYMGRVYSISGTDPNFPELEELPPYHPNCECTPHPVTDEALEARGNFDKIVKLSNNPKNPTLNHKKAQAWVDKNEQYKIDSFKKFKKTVSA